jgi:hypothetical protein
MTKCLSEQCFGRKVDVTQWDRTVFLHLSMDEDSGRYRASLGFVENSLSRCFPVRLEGVKVSAHEETQEGQKTLHLLETTEIKNDLSLCTVQYLKLFFVLCMKVELNGRYI